ncbi:MAG: hypothetical protein QMC96_05810 [Methanomicrobiales archaeon]|nr:hypothetical protein [Methanomicrobiales archaeon]
MMSLVAMREVLDSIPTWPRETPPLMAFLTAFLLPLAVGIIAGLVGGVPCPIGGQLASNRQRDDPAVTRRPG